MKNNKEATLKEWGELLDKMGLNDVSTTKINIARILDSDASRLINEEMSKERYNQIIDEAYENYCNNINLPPTTTLPLGTKVVPTLYSKQEFINKCKTDTEFSEKWGLKIEERELSFNERIKHIVNSLKSNAPLLMEEDEKTIEWLNNNNVPTKLITLTYNNETIEVYE